jgi:hypothetical protein
MAKISRHASEMGVFSEQLENPGFKVPFVSAASFDSVGSLLE